MVSTASCAPPHNGSPLAITSILLSSCRAMCSKLRSLSRVLVVTLAPASRQTLAAARSKGTPFFLSPVRVTSILKGHGERIVLHKDSHYFTNADSAADHWL